MPINGKSIIVLTNCLCVLESLSLQLKECQKLYFHSLLYFSMHQLSLLSGRHMHTSRVKYQRFIGRDNIHLSMVKKYPRMAAVPSLNPGDRSTSWTDVSLSGAFSVCDLWGKSRRLLALPMSF